MKRSVRKMIKDAQQKGHSVEQMLLQSLRGCRQLKISLNTQTINVDTNLGRYDKKLGIKQLGKIDALITIFGYKTVYKEFK